MNILEAALFTNLSDRSRRDVDDHSARGSMARPVAAVAVLVALFGTLELASPARPAELMAQAGIATTGP